MLFRSIRGKRPSKGAKDETEKILASWISHQLKNRKKCQQIMSDEEIRDLWDAFISEHGKYFKSHQDEEEKPFFEIDGKRPLEANETEGDSK